MEKKPEENKTTTQKTLQHKRKIFSEESIITLIIIVLLFWGIIGVILINYYAKEPPAPYSTLSFDKPNELPHLVRVGSSHNFTYTIQSKEYNTTNYTITTTYELYRLYDITEGLHSCLSPYRRKVYLEWTNTTNITHITTPRKTIIPDMSILPSKEHPITWTDQHTLKFDQGISPGNGTYVIYYQNLDTNETIYTIRIETGTGNVYFNNVWKNNITLHTQNDKGQLIYKEGKLSFIFNKQKVFTETITIPPRGQFGFETRDLFLSIGGIKLQHTNEIDVPDKENVWEYVIDTNIQYRWQSRIRQGITSSYELYRNYRDLDNFTKPSNITIIMDYIDQNLIIDLRPHFWQLGTEDPRLPWNKTIINISYTPPQANESHTIMLGNQTGIRISSTKTELITITDTLHTLSLPAHYTENQTDAYILLYTNNNTITLQGNKTALVAQTNKLYNESIFIYNENTYTPINDISITNDKKSCLGRQVYDYCYMTLLTPVRTIPRPEPEQKYYFTKKPETIIPTEQLAEEIPTTNVQFDGVLASITNQTNYSLATRFIYLDGEGIITLGLATNNTAIFTATLSLKEKTLTYKTPQTNIQKKINATNLTADWIIFRVTKQKQNLIISVNNTQILTITAPRLRPNSTAYFTYETKNSYFETASIELERDKKRTNIPLLEDPCKLRLIHQETLRNESFTLAPHSNISLSNNYKLEDFFDYGKIAIDLYGSSGTNNTPLHIHYWMVRE